MEKETFSIKGIEKIEKTAKKFGGNGCHATLPKSWIGDRVVVIRKQYKKVGKCTNCGNIVTEEIRDLNPFKNINEGNLYCLDCLNEVFINYNQVVKAIENMKIKSKKKEELKEKLENKGFLSEEDFKT